jgi:Crinkler effector protein N-terminal domain
VQGGAGEQACHTVIPVLITCYLFLLAGSGDQWRTEWQVVLSTLPSIMSYTLLCVIIGETTPFPVKIDKSQTVAELKKAIKTEAENALGAFDTHTLTLYQVNIEVPNDEKLTEAVQNIPQILGDPKQAEKLHQTRMLSKYSWEPDQTKETIQVVVQPPGGESIDPSLW